MIYTLWFAAIISLMEADDFRTRQWASRQMYDLAQVDVGAFRAVCDGLNDESPEVRIRCQVIFERTHRMGIGLDSYYEDNYKRASFMEEVNKLWRPERPISLQNFLYGNGWQPPSDYVNHMRGIFLNDFLEEIHRGVPPAKIRSRFQACERYVFLKERIDALGHELYFYPYHHCNSWTIRKLNKLFHWYVSYEG